MTCGRLWFWTIAALALSTARGISAYAGAGGDAVGSPATTSILLGRLTDLHSAPLSGVTVILRNETTGTEARATTARTGAYRFAALAPGEYSLEAWKADARLSKEFDLGEMRSLELMAESFNLFNHSNVTELETTGYEIENSSAGSLPTLNYLTQGTTGTAATLPSFGQTINLNATNFYRERQIQLGQDLGSERLAELQTVAVAGRISSTSTHCVG